MISVEGIIKELGYDESPNFLSGQSLERVPSFAHIFRRAEQHCGLAGVYALRQDSSRLDGTLVPAVYLCEAESEQAAHAIHRHVWNQNVVPFVIVRTPQNVRIYSGFGFRDDESQSKKRSASRILDRALATNELATQLNPSFHADRIDDGTLWREKGKHVTPDLRVDWRLLDNLERLGAVLRDDMQLEPQAAHALIGKYVYLRYLRDRRILSDERLSEFQIDEASVFSRTARLNSVRSLVEQLDDWLNGSVFDIPWTKAIKAKHVKEVAGAFFGDDPRTGQLNLYEDYNFSYIPIETLSVVYEQFLHSQGKARDVGAYYTPILLVNFMLDELESRHPLKKGMRVLDPSCGSGAFLVQCYRRLIEKELGKRSKGAKLRPVELRELLRQHIFGIDRDEDACQVTELSLTLTLLDYVDPPDLTNTNFKLPVLRNANIYGGPTEDFFNLESKFHQSMNDAGFDWIVGNPPWTEISTERPRPEDQFAATWKSENEHKFPTGGNQIAELFAWKVTEHVHAEGNIGLLLPAMTLFKDESKNFRTAFFRDLKVLSVVNFANMAYVLFAGRSEVPAAAVFYRFRSEATTLGADERVLTYAPLVVNQESNRPLGFSRKLDTWNVVVNGSEIREIDGRDAIEGGGLVWKLAMWGSYRDRQLLDAVRRRFGSLAILAHEKDLRIHEGFQPREKGLFVPEIVGKKWIRKNALRGFDRLFAFPDDVFEPFPRRLAHARAGRDELPIVVSRPPHLICDAARRFAVYSDEFIVVRARQPAIAGPQKESQFLKALSLYLSSDFARYHQFLYAPQWGVSFNRANLDTLKALPIPLQNLNGSELTEWLDLHSQLVSLSPKRPIKKSSKPPVPPIDQQAELFESEETDDDLLRLVDELNQRVYDLLELSRLERFLVQDFMHVKRFANKGKVAREAAGTPVPGELEEYAKTLQSELDTFFDKDQNLRHMVSVQYDTRSRTGMVELELQRDQCRSFRVTVQSADAATSADFDRAREQVREKRSQWLYFERNLRIYEKQGSRVFLVKPLQRLHWLRSQALLDADTIIAETIAGGGH